MSIQRFDLVSHTENYEDADMIGFPDGDYVLFTDHAAEVERLTAERDAAVARAEKAEEALRWYADVKNYDSSFTAVLLDNGRAAREALAILADHAPATPMLDQLTAAPQPITVQDEAQTTKGEGDE